MASTNKSAREVAQSRRVPRVEPAATVTEEAPDHGDRGRQKQGPGKGRKPGRCGILIPVWPAIGARYRAQPG